MFKEICLHPVWTEESKDSFVDSELLAPVLNTYDDGRKEHLTSFLKLGGIVNLHELLVKPVFGDDVNIHIDYSRAQIGTLLARVAGQPQLIEIDKLGRLPTNRFLPGPTSEKIFIMALSDFRHAYDVISPIGEEILPFEPSGSCGGFNFKMVIHAGTNKVIESSWESSHFKGIVDLEILGYRLKATFTDTNRFRQ